MRQLLAPIATVGLLAAACEPEGIAPRNVTAAAAPLAHATVRDLIGERLADGEVLRWSEFSDHEVYSAGVAEDSLFSVGYWVDSDLDGADDRLGDLDLASPAWRDALDELLAGVLQREPTALARADLLPHGEPTALPAVTLRLTTPEAVAYLRAHPRTRYVEPMGFRVDQGSVAARSLGCGVEPDFDLDARDASVVSPYARLPWTFPKHSIPAAWGASRGDGVGLQIIDTGGGPDQDNLGAYFASGESAGARQVRTVSTLFSGLWWRRAREAPDDLCGHGTQMSGLAAAPRGYDGNSVGVAYRSNLTIVRAVEDVLVSTSDEAAGVRDALVLAGDDPGTRIVSMSIGTPLYNSTVADGVHYATNRGKLVIAAAGTSLTWTSWVGVIFPASMPEAVAVTGVVDATPLTRCPTCHEGPQVELAMIMQRAGEPERTSVSLALTGDQPAYIGGSSAATAATAGVAALVWARNPALSAADVRARLTHTASFYPRRDGHLGYGLVDAAAAVAAAL